VKVIITKSSNSSYWYSESIGQTFDVDDAKNGEDWRCVNSHSLLILKQDCHPIVESTKTPRKAAVKVSAAMKIAYVDLAEVKRIVGLYLGEYQTNRVMENLLPKAALHENKELAATVPAVAAANNRSDEIAFLEKILADCDRMLDNKDRYLNLIVWINDRIAQLRAMR